jgi:hypothetical protein
MMAGLPKRPYWEDVLMKRMLILLVFMILSTGCAIKPVYQVNGYPVPNNVIKAKTFALDLTITYNLQKTFNVKEGKESYQTYDFLPLTDSTIFKIKDDEKLIFNIDVFNPLKKYYKLVQYTTIEGGGGDEVVLYEGELSRKHVSVHLPLIPTKLVSFYYDACSKNDDLVFRSFQNQYIFSEY